MTDTEQRIISADSHVTITNEAFFKYLASKYVPDVEEAIAEQVAATSAIQMPKPADRNWPAQNRSGDHVQEDRIKDQTEDGIDAEILYSQSVFGFEGGVFYLLKSAETRRACFEAYNNALHEWIEYAPNRLLPVGIIPVTDPQEGVKELERLAGLGFKALTIPTYHHMFGLDPYWEDQYKPLWQAFASNRIPLSLHTTSSGMLKPLRAADPTPVKGIYMSLPPIVMAELISTWIIGGMAPDNPDLHLVLVESGIGWIAYFLERLDTMHRRHSWASRGMFKELPSSFWRRQFHATFQDDMVGMRTLDLLGPETLMFATDYPHPDGTWPESRAVVERHFKDFDDETKQRVVWRNAADLYGLH